MLTSRTDASFGIVTSTTLASCGGHVWRSSHLFPDVHAYTAAHAGSLHAWPFAIGQPPSGMSLQGCSVALSHAQSIKKMSHLISAS
jgi:hypothetical protein